MYIKVIGAGYGRTGTSSLQQALHILGYKCYHMNQVIDVHPEHIDSWLKKAQGTKISWEDLFKEYDAAVDFPAAFFYKELMEHYPEAKVILTVREPEPWYNSCVNTIYEISNGWAPKLLAFVSPFTWKMNKMTSLLAWETYFQGKFLSDPKFAQQQFIKWNEDVKAVVPKDRLLVFDVKQGWEPLCKFLGTPIPSVPFPHCNEAAEFRKAITIMKTVVIVGSTILATVVAVAARFFWDSWK